MKVSFLISPPLTRHIEFTIKVILVDELMHVVFHESYVLLENYEDYLGHSIEREASSNEFE